MSSATTLIVERLGSRRSAHRWVTLLLIAVGFLVLYPVVRMLWRSFVVDGAFSLSAFGQLFEARGFSSMLADTAIYVIGTVIVATLMGGFLAWAMERTDARINAIAGVLPVIPILVPAIGLIFGYLVLFSPESGYANILLRWLLSLETTSGPISIANFPALIFVTAVSFAPMAYMIVSASLRNADPALEEASRVNGASRWRTFWRVTLPTSRTAILSSALMIAILSVGAFTFPLFIGTPANITTASVFVYRGFSSWPPQQDVAIALAVLLTIVVQIAVLAQLRAARAANRAVIAGKRSSASALQPLGPWRWVVRGFIAFYMTAVLLPLLALITASLLPYRGATVSFDNFSLDNYRSVLSDATSREALINSFSFGAIAAVLAMLIAAVLIYAATVRQRSRGIDLVLYVPAAIPNTALAAAFIVAFAGPPFNLYGTAALLILAYITAFLPQASASATAAVSQLNKELVEASYVSAASPLRTARRIIAPQLLPGLFAGWVIVFFLGVNEVTISVLLAGLDTPVVGQVAVEFFESGRVPHVTAMAVLTFIASLVVVALAYKTVSRAAATSR
ncbi:iron ABC transporter permease [Aeromicrobium phragmitis]|uniref:Iron ABC transporter permease n=1 Tax=Aeromicrobium phragmitis TaxID=2478914 RepID=A0A3L8PHI1_9ACTN|nr:iron ABC transporter permease [Aeromicrobium phragmitis]RLV54554.1 iron ABC transporter permease [Aeromicrobium phragmitis]